MRSVSPAEYKEWNNLTIKLTSLSMMTRSQVRQRNLSMLVLQPVVDLGAGIKFYVTLEKPEV